MKIGWKLSGSARCLTDTSILLNPQIEQSRLSGGSSEYSHVAASRPNVKTEGTLWGFKNNEFRLCWIHVFAKIEDRKGPFPKKERSSIATPLYAISEFVWLNKKPIRVRAGAAPPTRLASRPRPRAHPKFASFFLEVPDCGKMFGFASDLARLQ